MTKAKSIGPFTRARNAVIEELAGKLNINGPGYEARIIAESEMYPELLHPGAYMGGLGDLPCQELRELPEFSFLPAGALERIQCLDLLCLMIDQGDAEDEWAEKFLALVSEASPAPVAAPGAKDRDGFARGWYLAIRGARRAKAA